MILSESLRRAIEGWQREGIQLLPPASEEQIHTAMKQLEKRVSADVVELYCSTGGFIDYGSDARQWSLWSLERVLEENANAHQQRWGFSDFLICSFVFYFQYENELVSSVWFHAETDDVDYRVAISVAEFFDLYLKNPSRIGILGPF